MNNGNFIAGMLLYATLTGIELSKQQSEQIAALNKHRFDARAVAKVARFKIKSSKIALAKQVHNLPVMLAFTSGECLLITDRTDNSLDQVTSFGCSILIFFCIRSENTGCAFLKSLSLQFFCN